MKTGRMMSQPGEIGDARLFTLATPEYLKPCVYCPKFPVCGSVIYRNRTITFNRSTWVLTDFS